MKTIASGAKAGLSTALLGISLLTLAPAEVRAQKGFKESLPESTLIYVAAPNIDAWYQGFQSSPLYKIWAEEEVQEFLADLMAEGKKYYEQYMGMAKAMHEQGQLPLDPEKLLKVRCKGLSFAVTDLAMPGGQGPGKASVVLCIDFGDSGAIVQEALGILVAMAKQQVGTNARFDAKDIAGNKFHMMLPPEEAEQFSQMMPTFGVTWGFVGGKLLLGTDVNRVAQIAKGLAGDVPAKSLTSNALYRRVASRVSAGRADMEMYMRPDALIDVCMSVGGFALMQNPGLAERIDMPGIGRAIDSLGLRSMKAMGFASGYDAGKGFFKLFTDCPEQERKGLTALEAGGPINKDHLAWIPKDVGSFTIAKMGNLEQLFTTLMDAVSAYDEGVGKLVSEKMREAEAGLELNIKKDIFGAFGPELITYSMPVTGLMATPEMVFMLGCKNADRTLEVLKKLCNLSDGVVSINESKAEDGTYYTIDIVLDDMGMGMDPTGMLDPTFTFKNGFLVFGMSRSDVKGALKRFAGKATDDVRSNPAFKPYVEGIPANIESLSFTDVASTVDGIYGTVSGVLGMVPIPQDVPIDLGLLPSVDTLTKHLFGSVAWGLRHEEGFAMDSTGPFGPEMVVVGGVAVLGVLGGLAYAGMMEDRARVRRIGRDPEPRADRDPQPAAAPLPRRASPVMRR